MLIFLGCGYIFKKNIKDYIFINEIFFIIGKNKIKYLDIDISYVFVKVFYGIK